MASTDQALAPLQRNTVHSLMKYLERLLRLRQLTAGTPCGLEPTPTALPATRFGEHCSSLGTHCRRLAPALPHSRPLPAHAEASNVLPGDAAPSSKAAIADAASCPESLCCYVIAMFQSALASACQFP